jgi:flagellar basal body-associated protein FliL
MTEKVEEKKDKKCKCLPFIIIIILLLGGLGVLTWFYLQEKEQLEIVSTDREYIKTSLNNELDSLMSEHQSVKQEYGELTEQMTEKDSLIQANAEESTRLLSINYDYRKVKRQLKILRNIQQGYIDQLDSLYTKYDDLSEMS